MKKILIVILCLLLICSFIAFNNNTEMEDATDNINSATEAAKNITVTAAAPNETIFNPEEQIFTTKSEDGRIVINVTTIKDNYENKIEEISVVENGVTSNTINNIVGYYDDVMLDIASSLAIISYHGRKWSNFLLLDVTNGYVLYYEPFSFADIKLIYQDNDMMDYEINENDNIAFSCDKILDQDSIIISYDVHDMNGNLQSGNFKYIISKNEFKDLQENEPTPEG